MSNWNIDTAMLQTSKMYLFKWNCIGIKISDGMCQKYYTYLKGSKVNVTHFRLLKRSEFSYNWNLTYNCSEVSYSV
jgi:hypothetical protein